MYGCGGKGKDLEFIMIKLSRLETVESYVIGVKEEFASYLCFEVALQAHAYYEQVSLIYLALLFKLVEIAHQTGQPQLPWLYR